MTIYSGDLLKLIEQSDSTMSEKIEMGFVFGRNYEAIFIVESKTNGVELTFQNENQQKIIMKGIKMNQFYNNKEVSP